MRAVRVRHARLGETVSSSVWHPCRGACREGGDGSGGVASLNHRHHSYIPPGCVRGSGPVCIAGPRQMVERGCRPGPLTRSTGHEASPPPREGTRPTEGVRRTAPGRRCHMIGGGRGTVDAGGIRGCRPGPLTRRTGHEASPPPREARGLQTDQLPFLGCMTQPHANRAGTAWVRVGLGSAWMGPSGRVSPEGGGRLNPCRVRGWRPRPPAGSRRRLHTRRSFRRTDEGVGRSDAIAGPRRGPREGWPGRRQRGGQSGARHRGQRPRSVLPVVR